MAQLIEKTWNFWHFLEKVVVVIDPDNEHDMLAPVGVDMSASMLTVSAHICRPECIKRAHIYVSQHA